MFTLTLALLIARCTRGGDVLFDFYTAHTHLYLLDPFNCFWVIYFGVRLPLHGLVTHTFIFKNVLRFSGFATFELCLVKQNVLLASRSYLVSYSASVIEVLLVIVSSLTSLEALVYKLSKMNVSLGAYITCATSVINTCLFCPADPDSVPEASPAAECSPTAVVHGGSSHQLVFPQNEG